MDKGRIVIGWVAAKLEALKTRPMTCFRCFERGHTASNCASDNDRMLLQLRAGRPQGKGLHNAAQMPGVF